MAIKRRIKGIVLIFLLLLLLLTLRLYNIQIVCQGELTEEAHRQQLIPVLQKKADYRIYDRNMNLMTKSKTVYCYLLHQDRITEECERLLALSGAKPVGKKGEDYAVYQMEAFSPLINRLLQKNWQAYGFCVEVREEKESQTNFLVEDLLEMYDMEETFQGKSFYLLGDGAGNPLAGGGIRKIENAQETETAALVSTIDMELQAKLEMLLRKKDVTGSVVVADANTGQVLAMAYGEKNGKSNRGSALVVGEAYSLRCFYSIIEKVAMAERKSLMETALAMGFGEPVFSDYPGESAGNIDMGDKGKSATATSVQVCQMLTTLANDGSKRPLTLLMSTAPAEGIPCFQITSKGMNAVMTLRKELTQKPLSGDGWTAGYGSGKRGDDGGEDSGSEGQYAIVVHLEAGTAKEIYQEITEMIGY